LNFESTVTGFGKIQTELKGGQKKVQQILTLANI